MAEKQWDSSASQPEAPFQSKKLDNSLLYNKYLWATLIVCSLILSVAAMLYLCKKKKFLAGFKRRMEYMKGLFKFVELSKSSSKLV